MTSTRALALTITSTLLFVVNCGVPPEEGDETGEHASTQQIYEGDDGTETSTGGHGDPSQLCYSTGANACGAYKYCVGKYTREGQPILKYHCPSAREPGVCSRPEGYAPCSTRSGPVCGCDGKTYANECVAHRAGAALARPGSCYGGSPSNLIDNPTVLVSLCSSNQNCAQGQYCQFPANRCGGRGSCQAKPRACPLGDAVDTSAYVCGCDGKTYYNACQAAAVGMSVFGTTCQ